MIFLNALNRFRKMLFTATCVMLLSTGCGSSLPAPKGGKVVSNDNEIFSTNITQCKVKSFIPSLATTRQLLIGFDKIVLKTVGSEKIADEDRFVSIATAVLDTTPISIVTITSRKKDCVTDSVYWTKNIDTDLVSTAKALFIKSL